MQPITDPEQGKLRKAAGDGVQATIWVLALVALAVALVVGIGWSLSHRFSVQSPGISPDLPTLPGKTPGPQNP